MIHPAQLEITLGLQFTLPRCSCCGETKPEAMVTFRPWLADAPINICRDCAQAIVERLS